MALALKSNDHWRESLSEVLFHRRPSLFWCCRRFTNCFPADGKVLVKKLFRNYDRISRKGRNMIRKNIIIRGALQTISWRKSLDRPRRRGISLAWLATIIFLYGCADAEMQLGRQALINNKPDEALVRFQRVAQTEPNYVNRYFQEGVWTYVGRSQYLTGKLSEARLSLEKALSQRSDDYFARLYLGLTLARSGDRQTGLKEIESGIKGIYQANESMR